MLDVQDPEGEWYICLFLLAGLLLSPSFSNEYLLSIKSRTVGRFKAKSKHNLHLLHPSTEEAHIARTRHLPPTMKASTTITAFSLMALAAAAPADVVRRQASATTSYAAGTGSPSLYASSFGTASAYYPTGTASAYYPMGTGASCSSNGELVCSSDGTQFGTCNFGKVSFQPVAAGTMCKDGMIQFASG